MDAMRTRLSVINGLGFVTTESQTGLKSFHTVRVGRNRGKRAENWQRAYVRGIMDRRHAERFLSAMVPENGLVVIVKEFPAKWLSEAADKQVHRIPVTMERLGADPFEVHSRMQMCASTFEAEWIGLLPEVLEQWSDISSQGARRVRRNCVYVCVLDTIWGRRHSLFSTIRRRLEQTIKPI